MSKTGVSKSKVLEVRLAALRLGPSLRAGGQAMAKKSEGANGTGDGRPASKSEAVREAIAQNPKAGSKEIIALLAEKGVKVSPTLVYYVRSKQNQARRRAKRARVAAASAKTTHGNPVELVLRVKDLAHEVGGIGNLKMLVDLLAE